MKNLIITTAAAMLVFGAAASAEVTGAVYSTDIGALIDGCPICDRFIGKPLLTIFVLFSMMVKFFEKFCNTSLTNL